MSSEAFCGLTSAWTSRGAAVGWCMFETTSPARARSGDLAAAPQVMRKPLANAIMLRFSPELLGPGGAS